ncbi:MAG TPA: 16S rRNA (guanine(527)-N(7))-methyltransferase RsmG [Solirubrobacteraceae bacterium]|nr:16S rRNA (guanine(527)-N(7))-methyltransferase RsmG [Solirubrobacteraceae bacterium]
MAALAERYALPDNAVPRLLAFHRLLVEDPLAPTAVRDPLKAIDDHLADSLVGLEIEPVRTAGTIADLGSGAGLPGLPLAIALPGARVALVDSLSRRCAFLERAVAVSEATNARVVNARAEVWPEGLAAFDVITARALAPLPVVVEYAAPLLTVGGMLVAWRGRRNPRDEVAGDRAAAQLGLEPVEIRHMQPFLGAEHRYLHLMSKVTETPSGFPRRPGMATKRPLGMQ